MSSNKRKALKVTSSTVQCEEKYCCDRDRSEAIIECEDCGSKQCQACDQALHSSSRKRYHERKPVALPNFELLCQANCIKKNFVNVVCLDCKETRFCHHCFDIKHPVGSMKRNHEKKAFDAYRKDKQKRLEVEIDDVSQFSNDILNLDLKLDDEFKTCHYDINGTIETPPKDIQVSSTSSMPDVTMDAVSITGTMNRNGKYEDMVNRCFHLLDSDEKLMVQNKEDFLEKLGCKDDSVVKVVSIFGNTGDGKSHTLNETFFRGFEVFQTSSEQYSCTAGAWAALDMNSKAMIVDTEGLLGISKTSAERTRLLLKILAISDVVIYRTRAERIHQDMFTFLNDSAKAYSQYFNQELEAANKRCQLKIPLTKLGPAVVIFHETLHTKTLGCDSEQSPQSMIRERFTKLDMSIEGFNSIHYVGTQTEKIPTEFSLLKDMVEELLNDKSVRSARHPDVIFSALEVLNKKFSGKIKDSKDSFPDQYFTCAETCLSCNSRCVNTVNHDGMKHIASTEVKCKYQHQYENKVYLCKKCSENGESVIVVPKAFSSKESSLTGLASYAWSGYVLECNSCGVIYRSRQYWFGNEDPDKTSVRTEVHHVWPGASKVLQGTHNAARRLVDGLGYMSDSIAIPAKAVRLWVTDQIAPPYWKSNAEITHCAGPCGEKFTGELSIHHCRRCGEGFCEDCSSKKRPVPERGWGHPAVRVCDKCYELPSDANLSDSSNSDETVSASQVRPRQVGEAIGSTMDAVASVVAYPLGVLKDSSRPTYWIPDEEIKECIVCEKEFGLKLKIHHCRACGHGVCHSCSQNQCEVPTRGWDDPVRVCDTCYKSSGVL